MDNNKKFMFLKTEKAQPEKVKNSEYPALYAGMLSIPAVAEYVRTHKPSSNLNYRLTFEQMVENANKQNPPRSPEELEANFGRIMLTLGGKPYKPGEFTPKFKGHSVWGILNGYVVTQYNAKVSQGS